MNALAEAPPPNGWTTDDLDQLPEDGIRRELIDGVLLVTPTPAPSHQTIAGMLMAWLARHCPAEFAVTQAVEVRISRRRSFIPDVQVVTKEAAARNLPRFAPAEVLLAIEIVSPSSVSMDRILKPALYAQAGIPCYWSVEIEPEFVVHTYELKPQSTVYTITGEFSDVVKVDLPWEITLPLKEILP